MELEPEADETRRLMPSWRPLRNELRLQKNPRQDLNAYCVLSAKQKSPRRMFAVWGFCESVGFQTLSEASIEVGG
jgi:hypothetical protein